MIRMDSVMLKIVYKLVEKHKKHLRREADRHTLTPRDLRESCNPNNCVIREQTFIREQTLVLLER